MPLDTQSGSGGRSPLETLDQQAVIRLLCRAATRLAVAAQGLDPQLDKLLAELRQLLRRELAATAPLASLVDAIDSRLKHVDDERDQRHTVLQRDLHQLASQLLALDPPREQSSALKSFQKELRQSWADGAEVALLSRLSALQEQVLANSGRGDNAAKPGLLTRLLGRTGAESPVSEQPEEMPSHSPEIAAGDTRAVDEPEQPFSRISAAVCHVLADLLGKIEPPPHASDDHRHASEQIAKGLNWYELVSTLEEISAIVLAALERGEGEIRQFLVSLSQRLLDVDQALQASRQHQVERRQSDEALNDTVRQEVAEMQAQVAEATDLERLKAEVRVRLDSVVGALDRHKQAEHLRQQSLEQQLDSLTERMRDMEAQAAVIEERMLEQRRLALLDTLTQLPNRQAYDERLQQEYQRWLRYQRPLTLVVCDVDHFKSINDTYGHLAGDKVLRILAKALRSRLRRTDFIARFGGEEFVILMPETGAQEALHAMDEIRIAVEQCPFHFREQPVTITLSAGLAVFDASASPEIVFERADAALYRAKQAGRNRCMLDGSNT